MKIQCVKVSNMKIGNKFFKVRWVDGMLDLENSNPRQRNCDKIKWNKYIRNPVFCCCCFCFICLLFISKWSLNRNVYVTKHLPQTLYVHKKKQSYEQPFTKKKEKKKS